jgi:hypothetical protein
VFLYVAQEAVLPATLVQLDERKQPVHRLVDDGKLSGRSDVGDRAMDVEDRAVAELQRHCRYPRIVPGVELFAVPNPAAAGSCAEDRCQSTDQPIGIHHQRAAHCSAHSRLTSSGTYVSCM